MPPLNNFVFDEPVFVSRDSTNAIGIDSPSSFERNSECIYPPPSREKSVSFSHQAEVQYIPSCRDWTAEERSARWHSDDDYTNFHLDIFNTIYLRRNDPESIDDVCHTTRGVECRDPVVRKRRKYWQRQAWDAVFEQQKKQRTRHTQSHGYHYLVAGMYSHFTQGAMRSAIDAAVKDEIDARNYQNEDNNTKTEEIDLFNDTWITSVSSSSSESPSLSSSTEVASVTSSSDDDEFGFFVFGEKSDFDNSWLRLES